MVLETAGKLGKRRELLDEGVKRGELERDLTAYQIVHRISVAYWTALGAERTREVLLDNLNNFERIVVYHRDRVREGAMAEADLLRVLLEQEKLALSLRSAEQEASRSRTLLFREMGVAEPADTELTEALDRFDRVLEDGTERGIESRVDLQLARQVLVQAQRNTLLQRANAFPDPEIIFGYKRTGGRDTMIAGLQVNLPFRHRNQGLISAARADEQAADATLQAAKLSAEADVAAARALYESRLALVTKTFPPLREKAAESARIAQGAYREGGADLLRLLDAERIRIETDLLYHRALVDYQLAVVELKSALGLLR